MMMLNASGITRKLRDRLGAATVIRTSAVGDGEFAITLTKQGAASIKVTPGHVRSDVLSVELGERVTVVSSEPAWGLPGAVMIVIR